MNTALIAILVLVAIAVLIVFLIWGMRASKVILINIRDLRDQMWYLKNIQSKLAKFADKVSPKENKD